jgi:hypothetical protein
VVKEVRWGQWRGAQLLKIHVAGMIDVEIEEKWESEMAEGVY